MMTPLSKRSEIWMSDMLSVLELQEPSHKQSGALVELGDYYFEQHIRQIISLPSAK